MWREGIAVLSVAIVALVVLYPAFLQDVPQVGGPATADSELSANSADSTVSAAETTSADYTDSTASTTEVAASQDQFDSAWVSQFISVIDDNRGDSTLEPCANLDSFAMLRFQTMNSGTNWEVTHYGYSDDLQSAYGGRGGSYAEEYFYPVTPSYRSPGGFAQVVRTTAPGHWSDLVNPLYSFYGVYTGTGPILLFPRNCAPLEYSAGVNQTQVPSGCSYQKVSGSWLVVELADRCV